MLDETLEENIATAAESKTIAVGSGNLNCARSRKTWSHRDERRANAEKPTRSRIGNPTLTRGPTAKRVRIGDEDTRFRHADVVEAARTRNGRSGHQSTRLSSSRTPSMLVGELAHRFLESWDFAQGVENFGERVGPFLDQWLPRNFDRNAPRYMLIWQKSLAFFLAQRFIPSWQVPKSLAAKFPY